MKNLKVLRLFCALCVVFSHSFSVVSGDPLDEPLQRFTGFSLGDYAVLVFFIISGIVIPLSLARSDGLVRFWARRVLRIFPALIVCVLTTALLMGPIVSTLSVSDYLSNSQVSAYIAGAASTLSTSRGLPGVFENLPDSGAVNVPLWTLKYELLAYACATLMFAVFRLPFLLVCLVAGGLLLLTGLVQTFAPDLSPRLFNLSAFLAAFFCGAVGFGFLHGRARAFVLCVIGVAALVLLFGTGFWLGAVIITLSASTLLIALAPSIPVLSGQRFGDYSYGLYIFAFPVQQLLVSWLPDISAVPHFLFTLLFALPLAVCSWHLVEKNAIALGRRL